MVTESLVGECGSVQQWWEAVESKCGQPACVAVAALVTGRFVQPSWMLVAAAPI
ncbi:hypothetical protein I547_7346 [Mycobacterium kansasii 824]|nr:hypothetical protein I547_7346 [Mycobacterium kansasii 824]